MGRPTKLTPELLAKAATYLETCEDEERELGNKDRPYYKLKVKLPTLERFAIYLGINRDTVYAWKKDNEEFSDIVDEILAEQADRLLNNGLSGDYNPTIAKLILSGKHNYVEKSEQDTTHHGEVSFINDVPRPK